MHYMPAHDNGVYFPATRTSGSRILPFSAQVFRKCMDPKVTDETLLGHFPGRTFYGALLDPATVKEMRQSLDVLNVVRSAHLLLQNLESYLDKPDDVAEKAVMRVLNILNEAEGVSVTLGEGYSDELNTEWSIPQCHVVRCKLDLTGSYFHWLRRRAGAYESAAESFACVPVLFLNMTNRVTLEEGYTGGTLAIDVYGTQTLQSEWCDWLDAHEAGFPSPGPAGIEALAGLLHLADTLATMHLVTSAPVVEHGVFYRPTAGDSLTDFWLKAYDVTEDMGYAIGSCAVCGKMFIGSSKAKRGHSACLNRQRVKLSRAKKFASLVESGVSAHEASKRASISEEGARAVLEQAEQVEI